MSHESHLVLDVIWGVQIVRYHEPKTADEIRDEECDYDEAEDPINVHEHVYSHYPLFSLEAVKDGLDHFGEPHHID